MVAQVGSQVHVDVGGARRVQCAVPRATQDGDPTHCHGLVPSDEETRGASGEHGGDVVSEGSQCRGFDSADAAQADVVSLGVRPAGLERHGVTQADQVGEGRRDPLAGDVGVRVRVEKGDARSDQPRHYRALGVGDRQEGGAAKKQRVVCDDDVVGLPVSIRSCDGLLGDGVGGVKGEEE